MSSINPDWAYFFSDKYLPEVPFFRQEHVNTLKKLIETSYYHNIPATIFLEGPTGTGKTMTFRIVERELKKMETPDLRIIYINGRDKTTLEVARAILRSLNVPTPRKGYSIGTYLSMIESEMKTIDAHLHVCIDEVDRVGVKGSYSVESLLYFFSRADNVSCTIITNDFLFLNRIQDPRVRSSITKDRSITFNRYTEKQCFEILKDRCMKAFSGEVISEEDLRSIARFVSRESGDIRDALRILYLATDMALKTGKNRITFGDAIEAWKKLEVERIESKVQALPESLKLVLISIYLLMRETGRVDFVSREIYAKVCELREKLGRQTISHQNVRNQLSELETYGLIEKTVRGKGRGSGIERKYRLVFTSIPKAMETDPHLYSLLKEEIDRIVNEKISEWRR